MQADAQRTFSNGKMKIISTFYKQKKLAQKGTKNMEK